MSENCRKCLENKVVSSEGEISFSHRKIVFIVPTRRGWCDKCSEERVKKMLKKHSDLFVSQGGVADVDWSYYAVHQYDLSNTFRLEVNDLLLYSNFLSTIERGCWEINIPSCGLVFSPIDSNGRSLYFLDEMYAICLVKTLKRQQSISMVDARIRQISKVIRVEDL